MIWIHAGLIMIWVILILRNYEELQITKGIKEIATKLKENEREWYNKTMLLYEKASKHHDEAAKELKECRKLKEELQQKKMLMEEYLKSNDRGGIKCTI